MPRLTGAAADSVAAMSEVSVRPATPDDAAAIKRVGEATWPSTYAFAGADHVRHGLATWWSDEAVLRGISTTRTYVAERDGEVIGMGNIDLRGERPIIWKLYVVPGHHGTGAGHALLDALLQEAPPSADGVLLEYLEGNDKAAEFYRRHGFVELRREAPTDPEQPEQPEQVWMIRRCR